MPARHKPSRRRELRIKNKNKIETKKRFSGLGKLLLILLLAGVAVVFFITRTKYWDGTHKLAVVVSRENGDVEIEVFDPLSDSISVVTIPDSTEVDVARQLGKWRIKNVVKLGEKDDISGPLLVETITKHFKFPVYVWADSKFTGFVSGDFGKSLKALLVPYKTNLEVGDRLRIFLFSLNVKNYKRQDFNLEDSKYLKPSVLSDGAGGFVISGTIPTNLLAIFAEPEFFEQVARTKIIDKGNMHIGEEVGKVLEVLGLKIVSVNQDTPEDIDCQVEGKNKVTRELVSKIFGCREVESGDSELDLIMTFGEKFEKRF